MVLTKVVEQVRDMKVGEQVEFDKFYVKRVERNSYVLFDRASNYRSRWGTREQIISDVFHVYETGVLPGGNEGRRFL